MHGKRARDICLNHTKRLLHIFDIVAWHGVGSSFGTTLEHYMKDPWCLAKVNNENPPQALVFHFK